MVLRAINSSLLRKPLRDLNQAWNCCLPNWTFVIYYFPISLMCVLSLHSRGVLTSHSVSWSSLARSLRSSILLEFSLSSRCHVGWRSRKQRRQDQFEAMDQHLREGQLDHEDRVSFVSPLSFSLTSWISGRDSCLVGVSCHSPRIWLQIVAQASIIMSKFLWKLKWGLLKP